MSHFSSYLLLSSGEADPRTLDLLIALIYYFIISSSLLRGRLVHWGWEALLESIMLDKSIKLTTLTKNLL